MCRTRQKNNNLILLPLEQELSSLPSTPLLPRAWEERKSIRAAVPSRSLRGLCPVSTVYPQTCRRPRIFQELVPVSHCKSSWGLGAGLAPHWGHPCPQLRAPISDLCLSPPQLLSNQGIMPNTIVPLCFEGFLGESDYFSLFLTCY